MIGLDEDILSTGITLYQLREGNTIIGNDQSDESPHIALKGPGYIRRFAFFEIEPVIIKMSQHENHNLS